MLNCKLVDTLPHAEGKIVLCCFLHLCLFFLMNILEYATLRELHHLGRTLRIRWLSKGNVVIGYFLIWRSITSLSELELSGRFIVNDELANISLIHVMCQLFAKSFSFFFKLVIDY